MPWRPVVLRGARVLVLSASLVAVCCWGRPVQADERDRDLVVLSDLHLGEGVPSPLEDFTVDDAFSDFVDHIIAQGSARGRPAKVILNGDTFDFLKVVSPPAGESFPSEGPMASSARDINPTQAVARQKLRRIIEAHPRVLDALGRLARHGHPLVFIAGNHDQELNFPGVRRLLRAEIEARAGTHGGLRAIEFNPHFHLAGDVLVEHGQRYEAANVVRAMNWPFTVDGIETRQLRPAASNYLVVEAANPLRRKLPHITQLRRGMPQLLAALTGAPESIPSWVALLAKMAFLDNRLPATVEARIDERHLRLLRAQLRLNDMRAQVNKTRKTRGLAALSERQLLARLMVWDALAAAPWLRGPAPKENALEAGAQRVAEAFRRVTPASLRHWTHADETSRLGQGLDFALAQFARVVVTGHTHRAKLRRNRGNGTIVVNSGAWAPIAPDHGTKIDPRAHLTYVDIHDGQVSLKRWDARRRQPAQPRRTWHISRRAWPSRVTPRADRPGPRTPPWPSREPAPGAPSTRRTSRGP